MHRMEPNQVLAKPNLMAAMLRIDTFRRKNFKHFHLKKSSKVQYPETQNEYITRFLRTILLLR